MPDQHRPYLRTGSARLRTQGGFSITETVVGLALLSVASLSVAYISNSFSRTLQSPSKDKANCVHQINSVFATIRSAGQFEGRGGSLAPTTIGNMPSRTSITGRDLYPDATAIPSFINRDVFNSTAAAVPLIEFSKAATGDSSLTQLAGGSSLRGNVRLIEHLYNLRAYGGADFCARSDAMTPELAAVIENASRPLNRGGRTSKTTIRIRPYDQLTGEILVNAENPSAIYCPAPLSTFPVSMNMQASAFDSVSGRGTMARPRNEARLAAAKPSAMGLPRYIGYQVDVTTTVMESADREPTASCTGTSRFEYQMLEKLPEPPRVVSIVENSTLSGTGVNADGGNRLTAGNSQTNTIRVLISHRAQGATMVNPAAPANNPLPPGSVLLCRDRSRVPTSANYWATRVACYGGADGPGPQKAPNTASAPERYNLVRLDDSQPSSPMSARGNDMRLIKDAVASVDGSWQPCESVPLCGVQPESSVLVTRDVTADYTDIEDTSGRLTKGNFAIRNTYRNLRADCVPIIEVRVVSASGQVSDQAEIRVRMPAGTHTFSKANDLANEVGRRQCGDWCPLQGSRSFTVPYDGVGTEPPSNRSYTIDNDGYEVSPGVPRRMLGFAPPPLATTGAEGYWQVGGCCVSPLPPDTVAAAGDTAIRNFNQTNACRPGWRYRNAGTATNPERAPSATATRETSVAFSDDQAAAPRITDLDSLDYANASMLPWTSVPSAPKYAHSADLVGETGPSDPNPKNDRCTGNLAARLCCMMPNFCAP